MGRASAIIVFLGLGFLSAPAAYAALFVYQLPDGSRMATDHLLRNPNYVLIRSGRSVAGVGLLLAGRTPQISHVNTKAYDRLIDRSAKRDKVNVALVKAIIHVESGFNPYATSDKGACGLMQLMPNTAQKYGVDNVYDPKENIRAGVLQLKYLLRKFGNNVRLAVAAYNAGVKAVQKYGGIPPYGETRDYVRRVLLYKRQYTRLAHDSGS